MSEAATVPTSYDRTQRDDYCRCAKAAGVFGKYGYHFKPNPDDPERPAADFWVGHCDEFRQIVAQLAQSKTNLESAEARIVGHFGSSAQEAERSYAKDQVAHWKGEYRRLYEGDQDFVTQARAAV